MNSLDAGLFELEHERYLTPRVHAFDKKQQVIVLRTSRCCKVAIATFWRQQYGMLCAAEPRS